MKAAVLYKAGEIIPVTVPDYYTKLAFGGILKLTAAAIYGYDAGMAVFDQAVGGLFYRQRKPFERE